MELQLFRCLSQVVQTFKQYADQIFLPYILGQLQHALWLYLVWDSYKADSLKAAARVKRGKGAHRCVAGSAPMPGNWQDFLRVDLNNKELFCFLSVLLVLHPYQETGKTFCV